MLLFTSCGREVNETADIRISLASLSDFLGNVNIGIDGFVEVLVLCTRADKVDDNVGVLDGFIVECIVIEIEVAHNVALATAGAELKFLDEIVVRVNVIMWEDHVTSNIAKCCANLLIDIILRNASI